MAEMNKISDRLYELLADLHRFQRSVCVNLTPNQRKELLEIIFSMIDIATDSERGNENEN